MSHRTGVKSRTWRERALSLLLAAVLLLGIAPGLTTPTSAHWADEYLDKLVDWGVIRPDQANNPDKPITRADFMAIVNRAYGYTQKGEIPFTDVSPYDWFYDDVSIAFNAGYISGTSATTVSPNYPLNREMAVFILGRNMMLKETPGEEMTFSDSRNISTWARGVIKTAVDNYIVTGYPSNKFGPKDKVSMSQMAVLVTQCVGTPVQKPGEYSLGGVFGNVTITSPNVTLRDTTISGDLYVSGGVGTGGVRLENVKVLGRIIVSGTGESEKGEASVVLRNVDANEMLLDNMRNKTVTVRADGVTEIAKTIVRTPAYLEDNNTDDKGLMNITLEGESGTHLTLAGRIKEVVNKTPNSTVQVAKGTVKKLTVDEAATGSTVQIDRNTEVKELNLDVATNVIGDGDIEQLNVNAPGCVVSMLPDKIYIRPGLDANISGVIMDHVAAQQGSIDPRLLSGYPAAKDIAPTAFRADFSGNKRGTVYWAVSSISDGSVGEEDLISPPSYGAKAVRNGSVAVPTGDTVVNAQVTGLTTGGSYYLSALLVDERGQRSPVKVVSFTTPDNTIPAFAQGYPYMSMVTDTEAQVTVMPTKSCKMYYAVLPRGAQAPTANEMKSAAVTGNLGYGVVDVTKNKEEPFMVSRRLEELKEYTLYLWLTDVNGANSSAVIAVQFKTKDVTPPQFTVPPYVNQIQATAVRLAGSLNEDGTVYWAVVERGTAYPKPQPGVPNYDENGNELPYAALDGDYAKLQVSAGMNCLKSGSLTVRKDTEFTFNVTGLAAEKTYDLYYLAKDAAGNFSVRVEKLEIHTQDNSGPVVNQSFSEYTGLDNTQNPLPSTDIILEFSEDVACTSDGLGGLSFLALGTNNKPANATVWPETPEKVREALATALRNSVELYQIRDGRETRVTERDKSNEGTIGDDWTIDYRKVEVKAGEGGKIQVIFPTDSENSAQSALNLASGATYFFRFRDLVDTAPEQNKINPHPLDYSRPGAELHKVPAFTTVFAQVNLTSPGVGADGPYKRGGSNVLEEVDLSFRMDPDATEKVEDSNSYDILLYADTVTQYNLYYRVLEGKTVIKNPQNNDQYKEFLLPSQEKTPDANGWFYLGNSQDVNPAPDWSGRSVNGFFNQCSQTSFPRVNQLNENLTYEFVIALTQYGTSKDRPTWNGQINFEVHVVAGLSNSLYRLSTDPSKNSLDQFIKDGLENGGVVSIGINRTQNYLPLRGSFIDSQLPEFHNGYPQFEPGDSFVNIKFRLSRAGTIYYVIAERSQLTPEISGSPNLSSDEIWSKVPESTPEDPVNNATEIPNVTIPVSGDIFNPAPYRNSAICGNVAYPGGGFTMDHLLSVANKQNLKPETEYYAYFVLKGVADKLSPVYTLKFTTTETSKPKITLSNGIGGVVGARTQVPSNMSYAIFTTTELNNIPMLAANKRNDDANLLSKYVGTTTLPSAYASLTVIEAMKTHYNASVGSKGPEFNGYSVFDVYATDLAKSQVSNVIRNSGVGTALVRGRTTTPGTDVITDINHVREMTPGTYYWCLAVAYNSSSSEGVGDSFSSVDNVLIPDTVAPDLQEKNGLSYVITSQENPKAPTRYDTFDGRLNLLFDKPVYWSKSGDGTGSALPVVATNDKPPIPANATKVGILQDLGGTAPSIGADALTVTVPSTSTNAQSSFALAFKGLKVGDTITLFNEGFISNQGGYSSTRKLQLTLMWGKIPSQSGMGLEEAYFEASWING